MTLDLLASGLSLVLVLSAVFILWKKRRLPDAISGPKGWPYIGNALQMDPSCPHITLSEWTRQYGDLYSIKMFGEEILVVGGEDTIHEVLIKKSTQFADRQLYFRTKCIIPDNEQGIALAYYTDGWITRKKIMTHAFKMYGDGLKKLENITLDIIDDLVSLWNKKKKVSFNPKEDLHVAVSNIMLSLMCGFKLPEDHPDMEQIIYYNTRSELFSPASGIELDLFPWLRFFGHNMYKKLLGIRVYMDTTLQNIIKKTKENMDYENPKCVLDALHIELLKCKDESALSEKIIQTLFADVFAGGTQTTSSTLLSLLAQCAADESFQDHLRTCIKDVIGNRKPRLQDRNKIPLVEATLLEILRLMSVLPLLMPHKTIQDTSIRDIPVLKDAVVWVNLWSLHHDDRYWNDPWDFKPDRFLDECGQLVPPDHPNRKRLLSFGAGRRICLGEGLARNRIFLMFTSLIQQFHFKCGNIPPDCNPNHQKLGIVLYPQDYEIIVEPLI